MENSTFGHAHGASAHPEFLRDILRPLTVDNDAPKRAPGSFFKIGLNELQCFAEKLLTVLRLVFRVVGQQYVGKLRPPGPSIAASGRGRLTLFGAEIVENFVRRDRAQPASKRIGRPIAAKAVKMCRNRLKDFLKNVGAVLMRQLHRPAPMPDERRIEIDQAIPSRGLIGVETGEQASRRRSRVTLRGRRFFGLHHSRGGGFLPSRTHNQAQAGHDHETSDDAHEDEGALEPRARPRNVAGERAVNN